MLRMFAEHLLSVVQGVAVFGLLIFVAATIFWLPDKGGVA